VIIGMINATISLYYYLIVIKAAYLLEPVSALPDGACRPWTRYLSIALVVLMIYPGNFPEQFVALTEAAHGACRSSVRLIAHLELQDT